MSSLLLIDPIKSLQNSFSYRQHYAISFAANAAGWWAIFGVVAVTSRVLYNIFEKKAKGRRHSIHPNYELGNVQNDPNSLLAESGQYHNVGDAHPPMVFDPHFEALRKCCAVVYSCSSWFAWLAFSTIPLWFSAFMMMPLWLGVLGTFAVLAIRFAEALIRFSPDRPEEYKIGEALKKSYSGGPIKIIVGLVVLFILALLMNLVTWKSCVNAKIDADEGVRFGKKDKFFYSSAFSRLIQVGTPSCPVGPPCHVYATLPFDSATGVFLTVHTHPGVNEVIFKYDTVENNKTNNGVLANEVKSHHAVTPDQYDNIGARFIHTVLLNKLQANTSYVVQLHYDGALQKEIIYQTLPDANSKKSYSLIYGGDLGLSKQVRAVTDAVTTQNPRAIIVGGDLSYDDGEPYCYRTLDLVLWMLESQVFEKLGRIVPMIYANGNHDVGHKSLATVVPQITDNGPSYYTGFAQHFPGELDLTKEAEAKVPEITERKTYHAHMIGNMLNVVLDPGYVETYDGEQLAWLKKISEKYSNNPKIAIYHDPIYMPCAAKGSPPNEEAGRQHWVPVFDDNNYMVVFEHHAHMYKRTFPLRGSAPAENGTIYFGNGDWGVEPEKCLATNETGVYASYSPTNHVWLVEVHPETNTIEYTALDKKGKSVEEALQVKQNTLTYSKPIVKTDAAPASLEAKKDQEL